jgi:hypothetical protein
LIFAGLYRLAPSVLGALAILKPETVIRWHRAGFRSLSLPQTLSGWQLIENRAMLSCDEGPLQAHWMDGRRSVSVAGSA